MMDKAIALGPDCHPRIQHRLIDRSRRHGGSVPEYLVRGAHAVRAKNIECIGDHTTNKPVPRDELMSGAWPHMRIDERTVDVHIVRLRRALTQGRRTDPIRTVREVGYYLDGGNPSAPGKPSIISSQPIFKDAEWACVKRSDAPSGHRFHFRGKRHVVV